VQGFGWAEEVLGQLKPVAADRDPRRLDGGQRLAARAALDASRMHQHSAFACACDRHVQALTQA
jgi:hypothetical protein